MNILKNLSINHNKWIKQDSNDTEIHQIKKIYNLDTITATILANRKIVLQDISAFLDPKLKQLMPNPSVLKDMDVACERLFYHLSKNSKIMIFGDYDVDGITSVAILYKYLSTLSNNLITFLPNRYKHGYGLSMLCIDEVINAKPELVILLDNGSSSVIEIEKLIEHKIDSIIIDHHSVDGKLPRANAFINPKRLDDTSQLDYLCTAGLVFMFVVAFNRMLEQKNFFNNEIKKIDIMVFLDLVALGSVCDMVPLVKLNRAYVFQGIKLMQKRQNIPLKILYDVLKINKPIDYEVLGYLIGPLINCGGRMGKSDLPLKLLLTNDENEATILSEKLIELNQNRQKEESKVVNLAIDQILDQQNSGDFIFAGSDSFLSGVIGIVAGRIKEIYNKPVCIYSIDKNTGICSASGRSIEGIDLGNIIISAKNSGLLIKGGGHTQAVGFSFYLNKLNEVESFINKKISYLLKNNNIEEKNLIVDSVIPINSVNQFLADKIQLLSPFGMNFKEPLFMLSCVKISNVKQIGANKNHLQLDVSDGFKYKIKSFCYKSLPGNLGDVLLKKNNEFVHLVVNIKSNFYQGKNYVNLVIVDIAEL